MRNVVFKRDFHEVVKHSQHRGDIDDTAIDEVRNKADLKKTQEDVNNASARNHSKLKKIYRLFFQLTMFAAKRNSQFFNFSFK